MYGGLVLLTMLYIKLSQIYLKAIVAAENSTGMLGKEIIIQFVLYLMIDKVGIFCIVH